MGESTTWPIVTPATERRVALIVLAVFLMAGAAWILLTDLVLYWVVSDRAVIARLETAKGWMFVALAAGIVYWVTLRSARQLTKTNRTLAAVVKSIGDGVLILGPNRTITYANPASVEMLNSTADDLRGMGAEEFSRRFRVSYPDGRLVPPGQFVSQRVFDQPGPIRYKAVLTPPDKPELVISCTAACVRMEIEKAPELVVSVLTDITAAEHLESLRDGLFSAAAHAMKTPVAVIKGASQLISSGVPPALRGSALMIERQCARIDRLVDNLLVLSRIRSGTLQVYPAELELDGLIEEAVAEMTRLSFGHDIRVRIESRPCVRGDRERLRLVVRNALHSAARASRRGGDLLLCLCRNGDDAEIKVSYHHDLENAAHAAGAPDNDFEDMGTSRHVTAAIVEAHGGSVTEHAESGVTTVGIRLPAIPGDGA